MAAWLNTGSEFMGLLAAKISDLQSHFAVELFVLMTLHFYMDTDN